MKGKAYGGLEIRETLLYPIMAVVYLLPLKSREKGVVYGTLFTFMNTIAKCLLCLAVNYYFGDGVAGTGAGRGLRLTGFSYFHGSLNGR